MRTLDKIVIVDLECTCWENENQKPRGETNEIIEIGAALVDLESLKIEKTKSILVKPTMSKVSRFCTELTTLTQEIVNKGTTFASACHILKDEFETHQRTWASWGDYDRNMFEKQCSNMGVRYPFGPRHINLKNTFAVLHGLSKELGMPNALTHSKLPLEGTHHRGVDDATNIAKIFVNMVQTFRNGTANRNF